MNLKLTIAVAAAAALLVGGTAAVYAATNDDLRGSDRSRVTAAALKAVGGGTVTEAEREDGGYYDVTVIGTDGTEIDVRLDSSLKAVSIDRDDAAVASTSPSSSGRSTTSTTDDDELPAGSERDRVTAAARKAVGGGTITDAEANHGGYDVEIVDSAGREVDVRLDAQLKVLSVDRD